MGHFIQKESGMSKEQPSIIQLKPLYLARAQAASFLSLSESMLDKLVAQGNAPKPRKLSSGRSGWLVAELEIWGNSLPVSDLLPPANCGYGRAGKAS
jgi:prophage regulatory protein